MRLTVMMGLDHIEPEDRNIEASRVLRDLADKVRTKHDLEAGDTFILRDINGNRIGVADVFTN